MVSVRPPRSVRCDGPVGFTGIGHFDEPEPTRATSILVGHQCDLFDAAVCPEDISQLSFGCSVGQIPNVKVLHRNSSFSKSSRLVGVGVVLDGLSSESRGGGGKARIAWVRATEAERTAAIRREASRMPQR
jgi:hypothetical protein